MTGLKELNASGSAFNQFNNVFNHVMLLVSVQDNVLGRVAT